MTTPAVNYIPQFQLANNSPAASYVLKAYEAGGTSSAVTTYKSASDGTGGTTFTLNSRGEPESGGAVFAPHYAESVDVWIFPTQAEADSNDTTNAIQVIDASVINPFAVLQDTVQRIDSAVGSAADAITANLATNPGSLADPLQVRVEISHGTNTSRTPTFNLNSLGAKTIVKPDFTPLAVGDIPKIADFIYSSAQDQWILLNPRNPNRGYGLNWYSGLTVDEDADTEHDLNITAGKIMDSTDTYLITLSSEITKQLDSTWAAGDDSGGRSSVNMGAGADPLANDDDVGVYLISKSSDPTDSEIIFAKDQSDALADTAVSAAGYDIARRIHTRQVDSGIKWKGAVLNGPREYLYKTRKNESISVSATRVNVAVQCPANQVGIFTYAGYGVTTTQTYGILTSTAQNDTAPSVDHLIIHGDGSGVSTGNAYRIYLKTDSSNQIAHRESTASGTFSVVLRTEGWVDDITVL